MRGSMQGSDFPLEDLTYDVITVMQNKSKALEAFDQYIEDAEGDEEVRNLFTEIRDRDYEQIAALQDCLARLLSAEKESETSNIRSGQMSGRAQGA